MATDGRESRAPAAPLVPPPRFKVPPSDNRAGTPVAPALSRAMQRAAIAQQVRRQEGEGTERRSVLRGLILLAVLILLFALLFGGTSRVFPPGWWRQW